MPALPLVLYLASQSPRRKEILDKLGLSYCCIPNLLEHEPPYRSGDDVFTYLKDLAYEKALLSSDAYKGLILGMDTLVFFDGKAHVKPASIDEAIANLQSFSGRRHQVYTALSVLNTVSAKRHDVIEVNHLSFKVLTEEMIKSYCHQHEVLDKAGGYGIQDCGQFLEHLDGSMDSVKGVPVNSLLKILKDYDIVGA